MISGLEHLSHWQQLAEPLSPDGFGSTVVLSPHPDDESLGNGGTMVRLQQMSVPVHVVMVSDGSKSHPNSRKYPADKLRDLREHETKAALQQLTMNPDQVTFLRLPDGNVPGATDSPAFAEAALRLATELNKHAPQTVLVPWRRDPHRDHRATYQLLQAALPRLVRQPRVLEYPVWLWELGGSTDAPQPNEVRAWQVDISATHIQKQRAIAAHASQVTRLIDDDPDAFWLRPDLLVYFEGTTELYFEAV